MMNKWFGKGRAAMVTGAGAILLLAAMGACGSGDGGTPAPPPGGGGDDGAVLSVYVVNYPLMYFAERIGGSHAVVTFPAPVDVDPAYWQPAAEVITAYQGADLIVRNGAGYAQWTTMASLPDSRVVYTSAAFFEDVIVEEGAVSHSHGPEGEHSHGETAFTTWLDPQQAIMQAESIAAAMAAARPSAAAAVEANMASLRADLEALDTRLSAATASLDGAPLLASHPVYQYLARRYDLNLRAVHFEPDKFPEAEAWRELESLQQEQAAGTMLWEAQPLPEIVERLQQMSIEVVVFNPAGNRSDTRDYLEIMAANAANLEGVD